MHSVVISQLRTGYIPTSSAELALVHTYVTNLAEHEETIPNVQRYLDSAKSLTSPIRKLPSDILCEIFALLCFCQSLSKSAQRVEAISASTLKLTWICSFWRKLIHSYSALWSNLDILTWSFDNRRGYLESLFHSISLSGTSALNFKLDIFLPLHSNSRKAVDILLDQSARWRQVKITFHGAGEKNIRDWSSYAVDRLHSIFEDSHRKVESYFPILESLKLISHHGESSYRGFLHSLSLCPNLRTFHVFGARFSWSAFGCIDLSHITELNVSMLTGKSIAHLLYRFPLLQKCEVNRFDQNSRSDLDSIMDLGKDRYYSSNLVHLTIRCNNYCLPHGAWTSLCLPKLSELVLYHEHQTSEPLQFQYLTEFTSMLIRSQCSLNKLVLRGLPVASEALQDIIALPTLTDSMEKFSVYLDISQVESLTGISDLLTFRDDSPSTASNLESISIWLNTMAAVTSPDTYYSSAYNKQVSKESVRLLENMMETTGLFEMVKSRCPSFSTASASKKLKEFTLNIVYWDADENLVKYFAEVVAHQFGHLRKRDGLEVSISRLIVEGNVEIGNILMRQKRKLFQRTRQAIST
ncbi:hypothetical protein BDP27DRAFT_235141 [Rhodocollybia butyracea]|uniref:F-box domain-containing protein n=1 Tax=Rhodocollybia butyracea TaxID=206335 RepID=A0A9P5PGK7_9AGAR|nr:hypothetical protein BDP27DRAFT_235141 [Rhodocollybia butyracea]